MKPKIVFLLNSIGIDKGGLTHASLRQASAFAEAGYETYILTFTYNKAFKHICKKLVEMRKVSKKVIIRNMFEDYSFYNQKDKFNTEVYNVNDLPSEAYSFSKRKGHNAYRYYNNGIYEKYVSLTNENTLEFIDYFNENRYRVKREYYNLYGDVDRVRYFSYEENKVRQEIFYDKYYRAYLKIWYDPKNNKKIRIVHFNSNHDIISETLGDDLPHKLYWLNNVINAKNMETIFISDTRSTDKLLVQLNRDKAKTILRLHSNHLKEADDPDSDLNKRNQYAIENISSVNALVVLTERQRQDIIERFGNEDKVCVIPNYYEILFPKITGIRSLINNLKHRNELYKKRDMYKVVVLARFSKIKNIDHTIYAFKDVIAEVPKAKLEIWGQGEEKNHYIELIKKYGLEKHVHIKGYTQYPEKIYHSAAFSVVTSKAEGFSLSVMESMVNKTPVISYNLRYGPSDMIVDGKNGFLIDKNNTRALAEKMIYMLKHPKETEKMGAAGKETMKNKFNKENYQNAWFSLVKGLLNEES